MQLRRVIQVFGFTVLTFGGAANLRADEPESIAAGVQEAPYGTDQSMVEYTMSNNSSSMSPGGPFDIGLLAVSTTGDSPSTSNGAWIAQSLNAGSWGEPMGEPLGYTDFPTWQQYTGLSYTEAFPDDPSKVNGYFLDFGFGASSSYLFYAQVAPPLFPGESLGGFFDVGSLDSTFLVAGPADGTVVFAPSDVVTYSGETDDLPEPAGIALVLLAGCVLAPRRRR
jgi:hypothetical protein